MKEREGERNYCKSAIEISLKIFFLLDHNQILMSSSKLKFDNSMKEYGIFSLPNCNGKKIRAGLSSPRATEDHAINN